MPIVAEEQPKRRKRRGWLLAVFLGLAAPLALIIGVLVTAWFRPVEAEIGNRYVEMDWRTSPEDASMRPGLYQDTHPGGGTYWLYLRFATLRIYTMER